MLATSSGVTCGSSRMSAIWSRPPGFKTRKTSLRTLGLSGQRLKTPLEITRSTEESASGNASISPRMNSTFVKPRRLSVCSSLGDHLGRHVHADDLAAGSHPPGRQERVEARSAAKIEDRLTRQGLSQRERVPHAAEGFGHGGWEGIDLSRVVTQLLGTLGSDRELPLLVRCRGDPAEAVDHGGTEIVWLAGRRWS